MFLIPCPWCGPRAQIEFQYGGDASAFNAEDGDAYAERLYLRDNPKGPHEEIWGHVNGCRRWFVVRRDTATHEILDARATLEPRHAP